MGGWGKKVMRGYGGARVAWVRLCGERGVKNFLKSGLDTGGILPLKEETWRYLLTWALDMRRRVRFSMKFKRR